ncbi:hypothetical protein KQX66_31920 [Paenibacillus sp. SM 69]|nr:hypothetical protein [Paenibacillus oleatilyticus]
MFISINNNEEVMQLPVPPSEYNVKSTFGSEEVTGLQQSLNRIGLRQLREVSFSSFFPIKGHDYPFLQSREMWGMDYIDTIERWREKRIPLRLVITDSSGKQNLNIAVTLDSLEWNVKKDGDIGYTMTMKEFAFVDTNRR